MAVYLSFDKRMQAWNEEETEKDLAQIADESPKVCRFIEGMLSMLEAQRDQLAQKIASSRDDFSAEDRAGWRTLGDVQATILAFLPKEDQDRWLSTQ